MTTITIRPIRTNKYCQIFPTSPLTGKAEVVVVGQFTGGVIRAKKFTSEKKAVAYFKRHCKKGISQKRRD